jgi:hypothetical protein
LRLNTSRAAGRAGLPERLSANRPRRSRVLFRLFYQVEIRHRQLLSMISHPLRAVNVQCDYGNCVIVDTAANAAAIDLTNPGGHIGGSS